MRTDLELDAELAQILRSRAQRVTLPRLVVHRHLRREPRHVTAEQLHAELEAEHPSVSPATVYATLDMLEDLELLRRVNTPGGATVFDSRMDAHHHAFCRRCGAIEDIDAPDGVVAVRRAATGICFAVEHAEVQVHGLCGRCVASAT